MTKKGFLAATLILLLLCPGCRLTYLFHAARGQVELMSKAIPVEAALDGDSLAPAEKWRLQLVDDIKTFGEETLGLSRTGSYGTVYLESPRPPIYLVSACPKDRLARKTWWFPVVGEMPYLGFFDRDRALEERQKLLEKDLDVMVGMAQAYSTLGWFEDPITLNLIKGRTVDLVEVILHEMTHATLYVKGQGEFNEGIALLVGKMGARMFLEQACGPSHPFTTEAARLIEDERLFSAYLEELFNKLAGLYSSGKSYREKLAGREILFKRALDEFKELKALLKTDRFSFFGRGGLNNAYLMTVGLYHRHFRLFEKVLRENGNSIQDMLISLKNMTRDDENILETLRTQRAARENMPGPPKPKT